MFRLSMLATLLFALLALISVSSARPLGKAEAASSRKLRGGLLPPYPMPRHNANCTDDYPLNNNNNNTTGNSTAGSRVGVGFIGHQINPTSTGTVRRPKPTPTTTAKGNPGVGFIGHQIYRS